ncbi:MAG: hypothetical protein QOI41_2333 [Myxococcales bacterium]|nr:hypothetical protein [Myxococcales bacterium]
MTSRTRRYAVLSVTIAGALSAFATLGACSDNPTRTTFADDAGPDGTASLPDGVAPTDAGTEPDTKLPFDPRDEAVTCAGTPCVVQLVAGSSHFCGRMSDGTVRCWGDNSLGSLGGAAAPIGDAAAPIVIHVVDGLADVTQISAAGETTCARVGDGGVFCWGGNANGELGLAVSPAVQDTDPHPSPTRVPLPGPAARVDVGHQSACAVLASGELACWGGDEHWQLARPDGGAAPEYQAVRGPALAAVDPLVVARTSNSTLTALALTASGEVWSWGAIAGNDGVVAGRVSSISPEAIPKRIQGLANVTSLASSPWILPPPVDPPPGGDFPPPTPEPIPHAHACALAGGEVQCWGRSDKGALCTGIPDAEVLPRRAPIKSKAWPQQLAIAEELTCARLTDGTVQCCGADRRGRLGTGAVILYSSFFTPAAAFQGHAVQVATGDGAVCALLQGGTVECWGSNEHAELGGTTADGLPHPSPSKVAF